MENRVATGAEVFPKIDWNAAFRMSSAMWCRQESHRICLLRSCWRRTALPQFTPVLEEVMSKEEAMTPSEIPQLSRASFTVADFTLPVASSVLAMQRSWFPSSWMATTASLLTFSKPPSRSSKSFPSKLICPRPTGEGKVVLDGRSPLLSCSCSSPLCGGI